MDQPGLHQRADQRVGIGDHQRQAPGRAQIAVQRDVAGAVQVGRPPDQLRGADLEPSAGARPGEGIARPRQRAPAGERGVHAHQLGRAPERALHVGFDAGLGQAHIHRLHPEAEPVVRVDEAGQARLAGVLHRRRRTVFGGEGEPGELGAHPPRGAARAGERQPRLFGVEHVDHRSLAPRCGQARRPVQRHDPVVEIVELGRRRQPVETGAPAALARRRGDGGRLGAQGEAEGIAAHPQTLVADFIAGALLLGDPRLGAFVDAAGHHEPVDRVNEDRRDERDEGQVEAEPAGAGVSRHQAASALRCAGPPGSRASEAVSMRLSSSARKVFLSSPGSIAGRNSTTMRPGLRVTPLAGQ